eukprot:TRINITY_DN3877_c0_g1_i2.p1 TRINITY_DN3877_c0_g1~~TRINITY_DN3877_c0_g1_i2.p1  ORF type:complete len:366 (-),score=80.04 TRINITY_DN3877_c0_g1_i2:64-999(-)
MIELLLNYGAPWNAKDDKGVTVGEYALESGNTDAYKLLVNAGCRAELILGCVDRQKESGVANADYLSHPLKYDGDKLVDFEGNGVMMGWEKPLMVLHAKEICENAYSHYPSSLSEEESTMYGCGDILNVGFGLGLIDDEIQKFKPRSHTIIEAHPDVYKHMLNLGWDKKPGVRILFGRWQDVVGDLTQYDGIFFDTFGEFYEDLREFQQVLPDILKPSGVYSFFNGLAATNIFYHDVYCEIAQMELDDMGFEVIYKKVDIDPSDNKIWEGIKGKYWQLTSYNLPVCVWKEGEFMAVELNTLQNADDEDDGN